MTDTTDNAGSIFIGASPGGANPQRLELKRANRHGLIAGATGTGKTVTVQGIIEGFSAAGVPCFVADVKGDLSGLAMAGSPTAKNHEIFAARAKEIGDEAWAYADTPVQFWDLYGEQGHPDPHYHLRDGAAAAFPADGLERSPGRRADDRLPRRG